MSILINQQYTLPLIGDKLAVKIPGICEMQIENIMNISFNPNEDSFKIFLDNGYEMLFVKGQFISMSQI